MDLRGYLHSNGNNCPERAEVSFPIELQRDAVIEGMLLEDF